MVRTTVFPRSFVVTIANEALTSAVVMATIWHVRDVLFRRLPPRECFALKATCKSFQDDKRLVGGADVLEWAMKHGEITCELDACV